MKIRTFMTIVAVETALIGLISLLVPEAASESLGTKLSTFDIFSARTIGAILVAMAIVNWSVRNEPMAKSLRGILWANVFMNGTLAFIDTLAIVHKIIGAGTWTGIGIHMVLISGFLYFLTRRESK